MLIKKKIRKAIFKEDLSQWLLLFDCKAPSSFKDRSLALRCSANISEIVFTAIQYKSYEKINIHVLLGAILKILL